MSPRRSAPLLALTLAVAVAAPGCRYDPQIPDGIVTCSPGGAGKGDTGCQVGQQCLRKPTSFTGDLMSVDLSCDGSIFGIARDTRYHLLGFRCCAD